MCCCREGKRKAEYIHNNLLTSFDKREFFFIKEKSDAEMFRLCDAILSGKPVIANFDGMSVADCNYMLAFISGVVYACHGETMKLDKRLYLFARKEEYEDGSIAQYVKDLT